MSSSPYIFCESTMLKDRKIPAGKDMDKPLPTEHPVMVT